MVYITDNRTGSEFFLDNEQLNLLLLLDGTKTIDGVLSEYKSEDRKNVESFIHNMMKTDLLENLDNPEKRSISHKKIEPYLQGVLFDITSECNLKCNHCYVSDFYRGSKGKDLSIDEIRKVLKELAEMNVRDVSITGGEPTTYRHLRNVIDYIVDLNIRLASFFTNGVGVKKELIDFVTNLPHKPRFYISLDGAIPQTNKKIRGSSKNAEYLFSSTIKTIRMLVERGGVVTVNTSLHPDVLRELPTLYEMLKKMGVKYWRMAIPKPIGRYKENERLLNPDWDKVLNAYKNLLDIHLGDIKIMKNEVNVPLKIELELLFNSEMIGKKLKLCKKDDIACFYHRNRCAIKANGDVLSCAYFDYMPAGNVREKPLIEIWQSKEMQSIKRIKVKEINDCKNCQIIGICASGCRALAHRLTGSLYAKDQYACSIVPHFVQEILPALLDKHGISIAKTYKSDGYYLGR